MPALRVIRAERKAVLAVCLTCGADGADVAWRKSSAALRLWLSEKSLIPKCCLPRAPMRYCRIMSNVMTRSRINAPQTDEYVPYYGRYITLVPARDVVSILEEQIKDTT